MNKFYTNTCLPSILLNEDILYQSLDNYRTIGMADINPQVIEILTIQGFSIFSIEIFKTGKKNPRWSIHVDGPELGDMAKINWIYNNTDCYMKWFQPKPDTSFRLKRTPVGPYLEYDECDVDEVASFNIGNSAIVQTGIPHTVINDTDQDRFCVSINLTRGIINCVPYDLAVNSFTNYIY